VLAGLLIYSIVAGIAVVQWLMVVARKAAFTQKLSGLNAVMREFQAATDDDARQALMLKAGARTLGLSLLMLLTLAVAGLVMALPLFWLPITPGETAAYMAGLTVAALVWWRLRRPRT
jgi:hypothetical protein